MKVVYFSEELAERAPAVMGCMCAAPSGAWVTMADVIGAVRRREEVVIRPASESEMRRAEAFVALFQIGEMLSEKLVTLLDQESPAVAAAKITELREAIEGVEHGPTELLDRQ